MEEVLQKSGRAGASIGGASRSRWLVPLVCVAFGAAMAVLSRGFLEPDEITHYLYARAVWHDWRNLVNIWGRLGATGWFCLVAPAGVLGPRLVAVAVMALTAHGSSRLLHAVLRARTEAARSFFGKHATACAWLLLFAQPCFVLNSFTVMTEMLLACAWVWTAVVLLRHRSAAGVCLAGAILGVGGLMRPEGWLAIAAWPGFLWLLGRCGLLGKPREKAASRLPMIAGSTLLAIVPVAGWYLLGVLASGNWRWFIAQWPWSPASQYGRNGGLFVVSCVVALAGWMWGPVAVSSWDAWKNRSREGWLFLVLPVACFFLLHGTLGTLGLFGSLSLPRYFVAVSPLLAVLAVVGLLRMEARGGGRVLGAAVVILSLVPAGGLMVLGYLPMRPTTEQQRLEIVVQALRQRGVTADMLIVEHPYVLLQLGIDPAAPAHVRVKSRPEIAHARPGTLLVADSTVWSYEGRPTADELSCWGYQTDEAVAAAVDQVPARFEPLVFRPDPAARVRLWVKQSP